MPDQQSDRWSIASLGIYGDSFEPDRITEMLGLAPTRCGRKGDVRSSPRVKVKLPPRRGSFWVLTSPLPYHLPLQEHLLWIIDQIEPKRKELTELAKEYKVQFICGFSSEDGQGGCTLDAASLVRLSSFGIPFVLDLYPPGPIATDLNQA